MKKQFRALAFLSLFLFCFGVLNANAAFVGPETKSFVTIKEIMQSHYDDMKVEVRGYIVKKLSHDKFLFKDGTGEIIVDIDEKYMPYENITPNTLIKIYGEVDVKYRGNKIEIDAHRIEIVKKQ